MAIKVQTEFTRGGTVRILVYVYDDDEVLVTPTSVSVSIVNPAGTVVVDDAAMSASATGVYEYYYTTTSAVVEGNYQIEADILDGSYHTIAHSHFSMAAGINE
jgi:acyl-[acyl carrier protein]--UDP-N-acetylglucosamine O-acyltransferase